MFFEANGSPHDTWQVFFFNDVKGFNFLTDVINLFLRFKKKRLQ
jgi:hypothetical protein